MANVNSPFGFVPIGHISGGAIPEPHKYILKTSAKIYKGDPVLIDETGTVDVGAAGVTTTHLGIAAEYKYDSAGAGGFTIHVFDDPGILYKVQTRTGITTTQSNVWNTADIYTYAAGSSTSYQSSCVLYTPGTSSKPWIILGLLESPSNAWGDCSIVVVKYNQHVFLPGAYAGL